MTEAVLKTAADAQAYALAGRAKVTLRSSVSGQHYSYKIKQAEEGVYRYFVSLLHTGDEWTYIGQITENGFGLTRQSKLSFDAPSVKAFAYFVDQVIARQRIPAHLEVRHSGSCGRCGRELTHPESIDSGIGPECARITRTTPSRPRSGTVARFRLEPSAS